MEKLRERKVKQTNVIELEHEKQKLNARLEEISVGEDFFYIYMNRQKKKRTRESERKLWRSQEKKKRHREITL